MRNLYIAFSLISVFTFVNIDAQRVIPSPRPKPNQEKVLSPAEPQKPVEIQIPPAKEINFQQLADSELVHPPKKNEGYVKQGEDREHDFKFRGLPVPPNVPVQEVEISIAQGQHLRNSPAPIGVWDGIMQLTSQLIPPDIRGAASASNFVMETTNKQFKIYNKTGTLLSTLSISTFFNSTGGSGYFDPHIVYDKNNNRFVVCIAGNASNGNSGLFVGVSQTADPTGSWYTYGFDAIGNANDFLDYPLLGLNTNWVVISGNDFLGNGGSSSKIYVMNRATLYAGTLGTVSTFTDNNLFTIAPAHTYDPAQTIVYLVSEYNGNSGGNGYVNLGYISGAVNTPTYTAGTQVGINQPWSDNSVNALQLGNANRLEGGDTRIGNAVVINGSLWFTHTVFLPASTPTRSAVDWWQINPATRAIQQFGRVDDSNGPKFFFFPSIAVNANGDALLNYCQSSASMYAGAAYSFHASTDAASTMQTPYLYKAGTSGYYQTLGGGRNRWGDYTGASVDPADNSFWGFGEFAVGSATWGTEIVHVAASSTICVADASFTNSTSVSCSAPLTVNFTNTSSSANTYLWYFGDGTTSTADNPSHVYAAPGVYTVKLVATSTGTCGRDSVTMTNLVNIGSANPCIVIMPTTGTAVTQTSCTGIVYDDGGLSSNYTNNINSTLTISPTGASQVTLHFTQFRTEATYDFLYVYDGPTTASPQIAAFNGTNIPADITSSGPSITIRQTSDVDVNDAGYTINWSCILPNSPPVANLSADFTSSCTGAIRFTNLTTGGANSWLWNFGDGGTSTLQHPSHTYLTNGTFTVTLTSTNAFGSNMVTKTNYITISKPAGPVITADGTVGCGPRSFTLTAAAGGNPVTWFNAVGVPVSTANPYITPTISSTTTFYAQDTVPGANIHIGPINNAFGTGGYLNASQYLIFNVMKPCILQSVYVFANGAGNRTFHLRDKALNTVASLVVNVPNGGSRVTLNFNLSVGDSFQLGFPTGTTINLYRNDASATFPYTDINSNVSIIGNTANIATRYYFCYDWIIQEKCVSLRTPITLTFQPAITASATATNVSCFGGSNGSATVTASGGTPGFTYRWSNNATTPSISGLPAGFHLVTVTDAAGCTVQSGQVVLQPTAIAPSATVTNVLCNGQNTGAISVAVSGGTLGYTYNWGSGITSQNRTALLAGTYVVTITDANSCTVSSSSTVSQPAALLASANVTTIPCFGGSSASISLIVSGGTAGYSYNWGGGITSQNRTSLSAGTYTVTITDANTCTSTSSYTISQPAALSIPLTATSVTCNSLNGSVSVTATGGTAPYNYVWSNGQTTSTISNLMAGNYSVTVTDSRSCSSSAATVVGSSASLSVSSTPVNTSCFGSADGVITIATSNATQPVTYAWSNGGSSAAITNVAAGNYTVTITDGAGCSATVSENITQPTALVLSITPVNASCNLNNGNATLVAGGGTPGYSYSWNTGGSTSALSNLAPGNYSVTVTDSHQCTGTSSITITTSSALATAVTAIDVDCFGAANGTASLDVTSGTQPFVYSWSNGSNTASIGSLSPGNYSVTVNDATNCSSVSTFTITEPADIQFTTSATAATTGLSNGSATVTSSGGVTPHTVQWSNGGDGTNLSAGTYSFTVTDDNGCIKTGSVVVDEVTGLEQVKGELAFSIYPNPANNEVTVVLDKVKGKTSLSLKNVLGQVLHTRTISSSSTTVDLSLFAAGVYFIELKQGNTKSVKEVIAIK